MWLLVRDNAIAAEPDGSRTLAACPDSDDRGEVWLWSVRRIPASGQTWTPAIEVDPDRVCVSHDVHTGGDAVALERLAGQQLVVVAVQGTQIVADRLGPWRRELRPGDVFVVEGEESESLVVEPTPGPSRFSVIRLTSVDAPSLRWVP